MAEQPGGALGFDLVRVTEAAALTAAGWIGRGDRAAGDRAAVDAMRSVLSSVDMDGVVVIGEGEKDRAPMLFNGERVGTGRGSPVDIAVDPLEGTNLLARGAQNAISVIGAAERGAMWSPGPGFYMDKLVVGREARGAIDITATPSENLSMIAKTLGKDVRALTVFVLDKPRHEGLVTEIRDAGARVRLVPDGDVAGALLAAMPGTGVDVLMGVGGTPEGVIAACALKALGAEMQCRLSPQGEDERARVEASGLDASRVLTLDDLVGGDEVFFAATGITGGDLLDGVGVDAAGAVTSSLLIRSRTGYLRFVKAIHPRGALPESE